MAPHRTTNARRPAAPAVECIVWDWNGTLLDDVAAAVNALNVLRAARALPPETVENYRDRFGFPVKHYYRKSGFTLAGEDWDRLARAYHDAYLAQPNLALFADAPEVLATLARCGVRHLLLSACEQSILDSLLRRHGLEDFFSHAYGADNLDGSAKTARGRRLLREARAAPDTTLFVGDTLHDHEVATALGCRATLVSRGHQSHRRLLAGGCPVFASLTPLITYVKTLSAPAT